MTPIERTNTEAKSADLIKANIEVLKSLFPEAVSEGKVDITVLKDLLGQALLPDEERDEKYGLNWFGKRKARQIALTPSTGTLRPCKEDSVDWDTTKNLMIEGDNLEVLKLLQKSYAGQVKLIYIDPPYNKGADFVYPDNYQDNIKNYLELTGQIEGGAKMEANTESSGRFHTDWLNMMYPRLKLARSLLKDDGVIFVSIDNNEVNNLKMLMNEIFGEENFVESITWNKRIPKNDKGIGSIHEYILLYKRNSDNSTEFKMRKEGLDDITELLSKLGKNKVSLPEAESEIAKLYKKQGYDRGITLYNSLDENYRLWGKINMSWPNANSFGPDYEVLHPVTKTPVKMPERGWRWKEDTFNNESGRKDGIYEKIIKLHDGSYRCKNIWFSSDDKTQPSSISYLDEVEYFLLRSILSTKSDGGIEVENIFEGKSIFSYPKPTSLIETLISSIELGEEDIVLDFFAGSGTTAHSVINLNKQENKNSRYIIVQLPEPLDPNNKDQKNSSQYCDKISKPHFITELTKERIRRAGKKIKDENPLFSGDLGFRVFKLDTSNILPWEPEWDNLDEILKNSTNHIKSGRSEADILYELLLKLGLDLAVPIEEKLIASKKVYSIGTGTLFVCLDKTISRADADLLALGIVAWHKELAPVGETTCVFLDSGFADDVTKTNLSAILSQHGLGNVRSL